MNTSTIQAAVNLAIQAFEASPGLQEAVRPHQDTIGDHIRLFGDDVASRYIEACNDPYTQTAEDELRQMGFATVASQCAYVVLTRALVQWCATYVVDRTAYDEDERLERAWEAARSWVRDHLKDAVAKAILEVSELSV